MYIMLEDIPMIYLDFIITVIRVSGTKEEVLHFVSPLLFLVKFY
jgi:hypothetical protein